MLIICEQTVYNLMHQTYQHCFSIKCTFISMYLFPVLLVLISNCYLIGKKLTQFFEQETIMCWQAVMTPTCKTSGSRVRNLRKFSSKFIQLYVLTSYCSDISRQCKNEETCSKSCVSFLPVSHQF